VHAKAQPLHPLALKFVDRIDMQRAAAGTGIELGLERGDAQLRQRQPFPPTEGYQVCHER
jgi:hypothetical protein